MEFDKDYFNSDRYKNVSFKKFSQYWWSNRFYASLVRKFGPEDGRLLEVGCGLGHMLDWLASDYKVFGVDINDWALEQADVRLPDGEFLNVDAHDLSIFPDEYFSVVAAKHVVEHLVDPDKAIKEMSRVLKPGGLLLFSTPNLDSPMRERKGEKWVGYQDSTHISLRKPDEWLAEFEANHLQKLKVFSDGFWDPPYVKFIPDLIQKLWYGMSGGIQAVFGGSYIPLKKGESMIVLAVKEGGAGR
jgi:ubiquinone/menaquinone biosynthesis C-methylase UbiE